MIEVILTFETQEQADNAVLSLLRKRCWSRRGLRLLRSKINNQRVC